MDATFFEITIKAIVAGVTLFILVRYIFFLKLEGFWDFVFPSRKKDVRPVAPIAEPEPKPKPEAVSEPAAATVVQSPKVELTPLKTGQTVISESSPIASPPPKSKPDAKADGDGIVGESKTVYIDNPVSLKPTPHRSEDLEREVPEAEVEPSAEDVEDTFDDKPHEQSPEPALAPDEIYMESAVGEIDNAEFPTGATFEQMANAYEVARGMEVDDDKIEEAVDTFYAIRGNNFCDFIVAQSEKLFALGQMLEQHVENDGTLIKHLKNRRLSPEVVNFDISRYE